MIGIMDYEKCKTVKELIAMALLERDDITARNLELYELEEEITKLTAKRNDLLNEDEKYQFHESAWVTFMHNKITETESK